MKRELVIIFFLLAFNLSSFAQSGWQTITLPSGVTKTTRLNFVNANTGYLMANAIYKTSDAGITWVQKTTTFDVSVFYSLAFLNSSTGYFCQAGNITFKTTNGGDNWQQLSDNASGYTMKFINVNTGWLASNRFVAKTTNGGLNFTVTDLGDTAYALFCMDFINDNTGWVAGMKSIFKTINGGVNWFGLSNFASSPTTQVFAMDFINESTGFLAGTGGMICKTTDSGITWEKTYPGTATLRDIKFVNNNTGWACGGGANLHKTTNTGSNWVKYNLDSTYFLIDIEFINENTGWLTTNTNKLFKTTDGGTVFVTQISSNVPEIFELNQNYPNPFNPTTTINYKVKETVHITLKVYDSKGKEVETLTDENHNTGSYSIIFNASNLSSGIYYYKLSSENFSETKKMILIK